MQVSAPASFFSPRRIDIPSFGVTLRDHGATFRLWAPYCDRVSLKLAGDGALRPMAALPDGWFETDIDGVGPGTRYSFVLSDGSEVPDPASRYQPEDVHGPSEIVDDHAFVWTDRNWTGRPWEEAVIYEIHVGAFTPEGSFRAAIGKLASLADLGITAIQLMPLADFPGGRGWGYDGVSLYAPDASYGHPDDLRALVDAAHGHGMMVFLDVVYNHFGPEGNYLPGYAPILSEKHESDFGQGPNVDGQNAQTVRTFLIDNAVFWLRQFHLDGLRFDAVQAIKDDGPEHFLQSLAERIRDEVGDRRFHLIVENSENEAGWLKRDAAGDPEYFTAQWADDIHHALHTVATGESYGYYADYQGGLPQLGRALAEGFAYQGEVIARLNREKGEPSAFLSPVAFVSYLQNHDQVGNRPQGNRIGTILDRHVIEAMASIIVLSPHIPLIFMGEDWNASTPFPYFSDVGGELRDAVRKSRREELKDWPSISEGEDVPDPLAPETFLATKLKWQERDEDGHAASVDFYRRLIAVRREAIVPLLAGAPGYSGRYATIGGRGLEVTWTLAAGTQLRLLANLGAEVLPGLSFGAGRQLFLAGSRRDDGLDGWSVLFEVSDGRG
ncbi:MAG TPA: malto-oligosyltrehalose trehalohydrolase [Devosiaceae bacterium]